MIVTISVVALALATVSAQCSDFTYSVYFNQAFDPVYVLSAAGGSDNSVYMINRGPCPHCSSSFVLSVMAPLECGLSGHVESGSCSNDNDSPFRNIQDFSCPFSSSNSVIVSGEAIIANFSVFDGTSLYDIVFSSSKSMVFPSQLDRQFCMILSQRVTASTFLYPAGTLNWALRSMLMVILLRRRPLPMSKCLCFPIKRKSRST